MRVPGGPVLPRFEQAIRRFQARGLICLRCAAWVQIKFVGRSAPVAVRIGVKRSTSHLFRTTPG